MSTKTEPTITCDYCKAAIDPSSRYVNAGSYSKDFHIQCMYDMRGSDLMRVMDLDALVMKWDDWDGAEKAPRYFRKYPTHWCMVGNGE